MAEIFKKIIEEVKKEQVGSEAGANPPKQTSEIINNKSITQHIKIETKNKSKDEKFIFDNFLDDLVELVHSKTQASHLQIELKALQNIGFLFAYGGFRARNLAFYLLDLSPTAMGKTSSTEKLNILLLKPAIKELEERHKQEILRYERELKEKKRKKEEFKPPKLFKAVHTSRMSVEAFYEYLENIPVQIVELNELGLLLEKGHDLIHFIVNEYGKSHIILPSFKNARFRHKHIIENPQIFFYGDTNLEYLQKRLFYSHLKGGLINRCVMAYSTYRREFEELPKSYKLESFEIELYNKKAKDIINFKQTLNIQDPKIFNDYMDNKELIKFKKEIYDLQTSLLNNRDVFYNLYHRAIQNFDAILLIFHLLDCYHRGIYNYSISEKTISKAIAFYKRVLSKYDELIEEVIGIKEEIEKDEKSERIIAFIKTEIETKGYCTTRKVLRKFSIKKNELLSFLSEQNKFTIKGANIVLI